ncbi:TetR/AcrR family transcriptional regulator [Listeria sp. FSL L7-1582]|uniref:TetR/AcrR family transcriptional regulator n=1 Tax=Listeria portnoyi TaxID=2713504 RepID=UPI00164CE310|nr:TetR/AcrR family transcriptional regulator [Listeria portnoyi]MBC6307986.1 TetR/AcrR family transcriptional regulator [Listeria portnoyi]
MTLKQKDPRVIRTRQLIIDAFLELVQEKDFETITVKDIAAKATVNRTTFYAHFEDKYLLLEFIVTEAFTQIVTDQTPAHLKLTELTIRGLILSMCDYQAAVYKECHISYTSVVSLIETTVRATLKDIITTMLQNSSPEQNSLSRNLMATIISSAIYDATKFWVQKSPELTPENLADEILTFVMPKE